MTCPDCTVQLFWVHWLYDVCQIAFIIGVWELERFLWRLSCKYADEDKELDKDELDE